ADLGPPAEPGRRLPGLRSGRRVRGGARRRRRGRPRVLRRADRLHRGGQLRPDRPGGDLRPGAFGGGVRRRRRSAGHRQRHPLRAGRGGVDERTQPGAPDGPGAQGRHGVGQRLRRAGQDLPDRWIQDVRAGPGARHRLDRRVHRDQVGVPGGRRTDPNAGASMTRLDGSIAIITGAARGQGEAQARLFVERGAKVVVADILDEEGKRVADSLGEDAYFQHLDVSSPEDWQEAVTRAHERYGKIDVLLNNAAIIEHAPLESMPLEMYLRLVNVNQIGCFLGMQAVVPFMKQAGGSIVNTSSIMGLTGLRSLGGYTATKFAVRGMTKVAAMEWGRYGI